MPEQPFEVDECPLCSSTGMFTHSPARAVYQGDVSAIWWISEQYCG